MKKILFMLAILAVFSLDAKVQRFYYKRVGFVAEVNDEYITADLDATASGKVEHPISDSSRLVVFYGRIELVNPFSFNQSHFPKARVRSRLVLKKTEKDYKPEEHKIVYLTPIDPIYKGRVEKGDTLYIVVSSIVEEEMMLNSPPIGGIGF